jgi:hypothetical protein
MPTPFTIAANGIGVAVGGMGVIVTVGTGESTGISVALVSELVGMLSPQAGNKPSSAKKIITYNVGLSEFFIPAKLYSLASQLRLFFIENLFWCGYLFHMRIKYLMEQDIDQTIFPISFLFHIQDPFPPFDQGSGHRAGKHPST